MTANMEFPLMASRKRSRDDDEDDDWHEFDGEWRKVRSITTV
jgi:hypothetical protein